VRWVKPTKGVEFTDRGRGETVENVISFEEPLGGKVKIIPPREKEEWVN